MPRTKKTALWVATGLLGAMVLAIVLSSCQQAQNARQTVTLPEPARYLHPAEERLYKFLRAHMTDAQGGVYTNLMPTTAGAVTSGDTTKGHAVLSESVGLLLEYAVLAENAALFQIEMRLLEQRFLTGEYFVRWVVPPLGEKGVESTVNSSIDDLRLIGALLAGAEQFGDERAHRLATHLATGLLQYNAPSGWLSDYADVQTGKQSATVQTRYLNLPVLGALSQTDPAYQPVYEHAKHLLEEARQPSGLYATAWVPSNGGFRQTGGAVEVDAHMAEQLVAACYAQEAKLPTDGMTALLQKALRATNRLPATVDREGNPIGELESPAVYALAAIYLHRAGEEALAEMCLQRLEEMQVQGDHRYSGGYVDLQSLEAYSFDQLEALLALREARMHT
ncbi:hypothetical protein [Tumebacillus permanentifrigoris]|uniref:Glycosyl hydrolase family 8 n=1 Tax=Tumebacillus permanentifrigoris TaxID=378543 RepID=A0A316DF26_9BACL|nr:hypothetical protein [Tumebacillus permanentifrigoris]PWK16555.1 hypothetical protein C7459_101421 [Tumebacillus permanentifrigoris]